MCDFNSLNQPKEVRRLTLFDGRYAFYEIISEFNFVLGQPRGGRPVI